jgi:hypothetical protein
MRSMQRRVRALVDGPLLGLAALLFSGCIHYGRDFPVTPVQEIKNNVTTQGEIFANFGEPDRRGLENGYEVWIYSYQSYELAQLRASKELVISFDRDKTVRSYSYTGK